MSVVVRTLFLAVTAHCTGAGTINSGLRCRDATGRGSVDWIFAYKPPDGERLLTVDSDHPGRWQESPEGVGSRKSVIGATVQAVIDVAHRKKSDAFWAIYNDDPPGPNNTDTYRAHSKGLLAFDDFQGIWLVHSVPNFPDVTADGYTFPETGKKFGQLFACFTLPITALGNLSQALLTAQVPVYASNLPESFSSLFPALDKAVNKKPLRGHHRHSEVRQITTLRDVKLAVFSKHKKFNKDIYADLIAPTSKTSFYVETWLNGPGDLLSRCNKTHQVFNVRSVHLSPELSFSSARDHSKWAVSENQENPRVCIGDINRQRSQYNRGGMAVCIDHPQLWRIFRGTVDHVECCPGANTFRLPSLSTLSALAAPNSSSTWTSCLIGGLSIVTATIVTLAL